MEAHYGFQIFNRVGHGVQVTAAGAQVISQVARTRSFAARRGGRETHACALEVDVNEILFRPTRQEGAISSCSPPWVSEGTRVVRVSAR